MTGEFAVGVHALVFLNHKKTVVSSEMVAENVCTNPARVRKILASLKKAGLVSTKEGLDGGYQFSADASKVNLCMIADALGVAFVSSSWKSGNLEKNCLIASGMAGLLDGLYQQLFFPILIIFPKQKGRYKNPPSPNKQMSVNLLNIY